MVKAHKHEDFAFLPPRGRMAAADYYVWSPRKAWLKKKLP